MNNLIDFYLKYRVPRSNKGGGLSPIVGLDMSGLDRTELPRHPATTYMPLILPDHSIRGLLYKLFHVVDPYLESRCQHLGRRSARRQMH